MMWMKLLLMLMVMHLLETEVEAVCALGRDLNKGEIFFEQFLSFLLVQHTTQILYVPFIHSTILHWSCHNRPLSYPSLHSFKEGTSRDGPQSSVITCVKKTKKQR